MDFIRRLFSEKETPAYVPMDYDLDSAIVVSQPKRKVYISNEEAQAITTRNREYFKTFTGGTVSAIRLNNPEFDYETGRYFIIR